MTGLRERKKLATSAALSDAALQLAAERGVADVTVEEIAAAAGVSVRTFFNYFGSKEEAVMANHRAELAVLIESIQERPPGESIIEVLRQTAHAFSDPRTDGLQRTRRLLDRVGDAPELLRFRLAAVAAVERQLAEVIARRTGRPVDGDPYPGALAAASISVLSAVLRDAAAAGVSAAEVRHRIDQAYDLLRDGFRTPTRSGRR